ncbi:hypothetical protein EG68_01004 [Paragonimus skrjabini miyazakii]|uniref:Elongator complex protein 1 n=1 Tax=Paragonimus skrjabini miyazakii TaxID=59628 RepID=A0A8S9Z241_9TREM|nr:hypothetical protein EG68_01004 [Paragonimus skrjabini miyazakii]
MRNLKLFQQKERWTDTAGVHHISVEDWTNALALSTARKVVVLGETETYTKVLDERFGGILMCQTVGHPLLCIITLSGLLLWRYTDDCIIEEFKSSGTIKCAAFCPDKSIVAFVSDEYVTLLSASLEPIGTADLNQEGFGKAAPVAVGWGKKETQFHGSLGKEAALSKPESVSIADSVPADEHYELAWRDDGQYFVVSWPDPTLDHRRRFRVFTESGELFSTSDTLNYWEPGLCWRPRIQLITAIQRRPKRGLDVIFFEINAERHGEFQLLDESIESMFRVHNMKFDEHGDVLAVLCTSTVEHLQTYLSFVRLLTCSNYHWSVKRELLINPTSSSLNDGLLPGCPVTFTWTVGSPRSGVFALYVANTTRVNDRPDLTGTLIRCWSFSAAYDHNECMAVESCSRLRDEVRTPGFVAVINGEHLQLTAMAHSVIPPPMCASKLTFKQPTGFPNLCSKIAAVSFPGPWVVQRESNTVTMLVQLESTDFPARLFVVGLHCGASNSQRHERFDCADDILVEAEWITGAQNVIPWPRYVHAINLLDTACPKENHRVNEILSRWSHVPICGGNELSHFCWLSCSQFVFTICAGQLVGLADLDLSDLSATRVRWLLAVGSSLSKSSTDHTNPCDSTLRICGLCLSIDEHRLYVQFTNGYVVIYSIDKLIASKECHVVSSIEIEDSNPIFHDLSSYAADCILRFPLACEQLVTVTFTAANPRRLATTSSTKITPLPTVCNPTRSFLLGLHQPSHRLYGICIPVRSELVQTPTRVRHSKPAALLMDLCSSILVLPNYFLVTSMRKLLVCVPTQFDATVCANIEVCMTELISRLTIPSELLNSAQPISRHPQQQQTQSWYNDYLHPIETGTVLVSADLVDSKVVLQATRGNLEQVHPRALVLSHLANLLDNSKYAEALVSMRRHRVNFNLLHDHNPILFRQNLNILLQQIECTDLLTLFVSELIDDDVCKAMYGTFYGSPIAQLYRESLSERNMHRFGFTQTTSKVNSVCDALLGAMSNDKRYILTILTCYAKKRPSELHNALLLLEKFRADGDMTCWESGVRHLQYFATPPELYRVALGTYDLGLAQVMAQRTQLDPKEYLANLNELRAITDGDQVELRLAYQRFKIDDQLVRYSEAVKQLKAAGPEHSEELTAYVQAHKLYSEAIELYPVDSTEFKSIGRLWATSLIGIQKLAYAGQVYLRAGFFAAAARTFLSTLQTDLWSIAVSQSRLIQPQSSDDTDIVLSEQEIQTQAHKLAGRLRDLSRHQEAIMIYLDHLKNPDLAIVTALDGELWLEARQLASLHHRLEFLEKLLKPKLQESYSAHFERLLQTRTEFIALFDRLIALRRNHKDEAEMKRLAQLHGDYDPSFDTATETDILSDTSSISDSSLTDSTSCLSIRSTGTRQAGRSAKNRRKTEARKWSTKPGSKYEEVGLLKALAQSVELGQLLAGDVSTLAIELWRNSLTGDGHRLLQAVNQLLADQKSTIPLIWDEWITGQQPTESVICTQNEGRKRYPFKEPFITYAPVMNRTHVICPLLDPN